MADTADPGLEVAGRWRVLQAPADGLQQVAELAARSLEMAVAVVHVEGTDHAWSHPRARLADWVPGSAGMCCSITHTSRAGDPAGPPAGPPAPWPGAPRRPLRFYAGAPLRLSDGREVGSLVVADHQPRHLTPRQGEIIAELAALGGREVELRLAARARVSTELADAALARDQVAELADTLDVRGAVGQAIGILMARHGCGADTAFDQLRQICAERNLTLLQAAGEVASHLARSPA
jgi:GAF domain-containing protein